MTDRYVLATPIRRLGGGRIKVLRFRRVDRYLLNAMAELDAGLTSAGAGQAETVVARIALASDKSIRAIAGMELDDLINAFDALTAHMSAFGASWPEAR